MAFGSMLGGIGGGNVIGGAAVRLLLDSAQFDAGLKGAHARVNMFGRGMMRAGGALTKGLTLPIGAAAVAAIKLASDAEEVENKVRVVFGKMADSVIKWSNSSIDSIGLSRQSAQDMATQFGLLFEAAKLPGPKVVELSKQFTTLAGDMASFFNVPFDQALQDLRSGLVGETEPLRKYGVLINEAALQHEALQLGLVKTGGTLTEADKVIARSSLIMDGLKKSHGDFAKTQDSVANQSRKAREQLKEMGADLGKQLLPIAKDVLGTVKDMVKWFSDLSPATKENIVKFTLLAAALGPVVGLLGGIVRLGSGVVGVLTKIGAAAAGAGAAGAVGGAGGAAGGAAAGAAAGVATRKGLLVALARFGIRVTPAGAFAIPFVAGWQGPSGEWKRGIAELEGNIDKTFKKAGKRTQDWSVQMANAKREAHGIVDALVAEGKYTAAERAMAAWHDKWNAAVKDAREKVDFVLDGIQAMGGELTKLEQKNLAKAIKADDFTSAFRIVDGALERTGKKFVEAREKIKDVAGAVDDVAQKAKAIDSIPVNVNNKTAMARLEELARKFRSIKAEIEGTVNIGVSPKPPSGGGVLPIHHMGGPIHRTGPALLQRGEFVLSAPTVKALGRGGGAGGATRVLNVNFYGNVYGTADFDRHVEQALTRSASRFAGI